MGTQIVGAEVALYVDRQLAPYRDRIKELEGETAALARDRTAQWEKINTLIETVNQHAGKIEQSSMGPAARVAQSQEGIRAAQEQPKEPDPVRVGWGKLLAGAGALLAALGTAAAGWFMGGGPGPGS